MTHNIACYTTYNNKDMPKILFEYFLYFLKSDH